MGNIGTRRLGRFEASDARHKKACLFSAVSALNEALELIDSVIPVDIGLQGGHTRCCLAPKNTWFCSKF